MRKVVGVLLFIGAYGLEACGDSTAPGDSHAPAHFGALEGNDQTAATLTLVPIPPAVIVTDAKNLPVAGIPVTFTVTAGGGNVQGASAATNANGEARVGSWRLGQANVVQTLVANIPNFPDGVVFTAHATVGPAASLTIVDGNGQTGARGAVLAKALTVLVRDASGNAIVGATVLFQPVTSGGIITPQLATTGTNGVSGGVTWRLPTSCGLSSTATALAQIGSLSVTFQATCQ